MTQDEDFLEAQHRAIAAMGTTLGPQMLDSVRALYDEEQRALAEGKPVSVADVAYGQHERNRLDIYRPDAAHGTGVPVLVFVHGGGFLKGDKGGAESWSSAHVGRMAARNGFLGVVINYRLAPDHQWPSGPEDMAAVVAWLRDHAADHGGNPDHIILLGTSAGAVHVSAYIRHAQESGEQAIAGAVLLSGLYGYTPLDDRDALYYGEQADYAAKMPKEAVASTTLPLLVACAQYDPPRFQAEFIGLMQDRLTRHGTMPRAMILPGHNHYSMAMHLGTRDQRLTQEICAFVRNPNR